MIYLHLINDEKFTDFSISLFEKYNENKNIYLLGAKNTGTLKHLKSVNGIICLTLDSTEYYNFINRGEYDVLFIHNLDFFKSKAIYQLKVRKIIVWLSWGVDIYQTAYYKGSIYQPHTSNLLRALKSNLIKEFKKTISPVYYFIFFNKSHKFMYKKAVERIDYCATVIPDEFNILNRLLFFHAKQVPFSYASIEDDFREFNIRDINVDGNGIFIGNSISSSSNHLDVIYKLSSLNTNGRKIFVPLNYGIELEYRDIINEKGRYFFGKDWYPLLKFISKVDYINEVRKCNIAIMNHNRQQSVGNLIILLWLGCKIFLSEQSIVFDYFKRKGFILYSFQSDLNQDSVDSSLSTEEIENNRELIYKEYSDEAVSNKVMELITIVSGDV